MSHHTADMLCKQVYTGVKRYAIDSPGAGFLTIHSEYCEEAWGAVKGYSDGKARALKIVSSHSESVETCEERKRYLIESAGAGFLVPHCECSGVVRVQLPPRVMVVPQDTM